MRKLISLLILFCLAISVYASAAAKRKTFTLDKIIEYALKNSPDIQKASAGTEKARGGEINIRAHLLPQVNLESTYTNYQEEHAIVPGVSGVKQRFDNNVVSNKLEASFLITDFGKSFYAYKSAKEEYLASINNLERKKAVVVYAVANIYFNLVSLDKLMKSLYAIRDSIAELQRRVKLYFEEGKTARIDLLKVNVRLAEIEDKIAQLKREEVYLLSLLAQEMGYEGEPDIDKRLQLCGIDLNKLSFKEAFSTAVKQRKDLSKYRRLVKASYFGLKSSRRDYFPEIKAFGGAGEFSGTADSSKFAHNDRWEDDYWAGIKITLPVFDSGLRKGKVLIAEGEHKAKKAEEAKVLLDIYKDIKKAIADIRCAETRLHLAEASKEKAQETLRLEKLKYKAGKGVINDVLDAEAELRKANYLYYSAVSDYNSGIFELKLAEGTLIKGYKELVSSKGDNRIEKKDVADKK